MTIFVSQIYRLRETVFKGAIFKEIYPRSLNHTWTLFKREDYGFDSHTHCPSSCSLLYFHLLKHLLNATIYQSLSYT